MKNCLLAWGHLETGREPSNDNLRDWLFFLINFSLTRKKKIIENLTRRFRGTWTWGIELGPMTTRHLESEFGRRGIWLNKENIYLSSELHGGYKVSGRWENRWSPGTHVLERIWTWAVRWISVQGPLTISVKVSEVPPCGNKQDPLWCSGISCVLLRWG